jgi:hypothetical protein
MPPARRAAVLLEAALLALSLFAAPALHRKSCNGVCAAHHLGGTREEPRHGCCAGAEPDQGPGADDGCRCLDDCCSIFGCCVTPDVLSDTGSATLVPAGARPVRPEETPRAPEARLLPYPTGPPGAA